jgi:hypothetical protein
MQQPSASVSDARPDLRSVEAAHVAEACGVSRAREPSCRARRVARRLVLVLATAVLWAGAGSALLTSTAAAGGVGDDGTLSAAIYNSTPYTWTLVTAQATGSCIYGTGCWRTVPAQTLAPGSSSLFQLYPNIYDGRVIGNLWSFRAGFDGFFTYRVDVLGGAPEYVTVGISQCHCDGVYSTPASEAALQVWNTVAPPPAGYAASSLAPPGPQTANPQLAVQLNNPTLFDPNISAVGNFSVDASTDLGRPFVELLNAACVGDDNTSCSFTQTTPITYGPGALGNRHQSQNCDLGAAAGGGEPPPGGGDGPPSNDPNYMIVQYEAAQSASLSVGGGVTASAEFSLFGTISSEASVSVEAEHEWEEVKTYTRDAKVYVPANSWGFLWAAPTVGRVTGTIVAKIGAATYTATNFTEERSGVTGTTDPLRQPTPAFNVVTVTRPMTTDELETYCGASGSTSQLKARRAAPPAKLLVGRSVDRVALGETQEAVVARLGWPTERRFPLKPCHGMPGCTAVRGIHGTWKYKKRKLSVVFGPDRRATALIHSGNRRTVHGVGKGSTLAAVRGWFPEIACRKFSNRIDCAIKQVSEGQTVKTVFRFSERNGRRWKTNKVLIYVDGRGQVNS